MKGVVFIKEYKGFLVDEELNIYNSITKNKLKPFKGTDGYLHVKYKNKNKTYCVRVHKLYAVLFIPNPNNYKYVNHIDSDKTNCSLENLEWCTNSYNIKHGWDSGNRTHKNMTKVEVFKDGESVGKFNSIRELSSTLGLDRHKVARILKEEVKNPYKYSFKYI